MRLNIFLLRIFNFDAISGVIDRYIFSATLCHLALNEKYICPPSADLGPNKTNRKHTKWCWRILSAALVAI